ncbi:PRTRC system protein C [Pseudomonas frederiksbergensis]
MAVILELTRVFRMAGRDMVDPDPTMTAEQVLKHYGRQFPKLLGAKVIEPVTEGDKHVYEFRQASFGDRG